MSARIVCVLRSGGDFGWEHVTRLAVQVDRHLPEPLPFLCLSDTALPPRAEEIRHVVTMPLQHDWPGWWAKLEMFRLWGPCLYLDLDVTIVGDLAPLLDLAQHNVFIGCRDFWVMEPSRLNSSVMAWKGDRSAMYTTFATAPKKFTEYYGSRAEAQHRGWGDQGFIQNHASELEYWQDLLPGMVLSYKRDALAGSDLSDARIIVSHGQPRPWAKNGADRWLRRKGY